MNADWSKIAGPLTQAGGVILGGLIGGPAGAMFGPAIGGVVAQSLGVDADPDVVAGELAKPGAAGKVASVEATHADGFKSIEEAYLADVQNARNQTLELVKADSKIAWSAPIISIIVILGFLAAVAAVLTRSVQESQIAVLLIGSLATKFSDVVSFWIGSSKGSADKTATIKQMLRQTAAEPAPTKPRR
ncbi:hypothetical protein UFOVP1204_30 [uncultured Caudovirales phage]|uniref:Holin of 3TMs, for gene-transfer release n=1 Tax=uncultured Caudovirales phage TaxID=2100421 RepID=A0A6J5Q5Y5_9CAUD|nr:hypothetical protein UFOVP473_71 [uncultured Caudovirales phage]CAB4176901.1 hypothetical protein UFOVP983_71 [uncultured Caudovirales phage]CAB4189892.1 hypothetical protein UFOVP1204_30 [uncultured Caudovirales phage]